jgi:hypothetical protein
MGLPGMIDAVAVDGPDADQARRIAAGGHSGAPP